MNLHAELDAMNAKREAIKEANTVKCEAPKIKQKFKYYKSPVIRSL